MRRRRGGFSLMEMLIATAILLASLGLLLQLAAVGRDHAQSAEGHANAQRICQNKLNEILAGAAPLESVSDEPLPDEPGWTCSVAAETLDSPLSKPPLAILRVTVTEDVEGPRHAEQFTLWRLIRDPGLKARLDNKSPRPTNLKSVPGEG
jgi:prepilin-type N-terminal cleavage/methylation domain-containing protein